MNNQAVANSLYEADARIEELHYLATYLQASRELVDVVGQDFEDILKAVGYSKNNLDTTDWADEEFLEFITELQGKLGFLAKAATPVPTDFHIEEGEIIGYNMTWGWYASKWVYGETMEDVVTKTLDWQAEYLKERKVQALAKEEK